MQGARPDLTPEAMARAMQSSDTAYDGLFYTCVITTGIFCLASCPARKPLIKNVRFARSREEAVQWGFRPCKRCRPDLDSGRKGYEAGVVAQVQALVAERLDHITIDELAGALALSPDHLRRLFRRSSGLSVHEYILGQRVAQARVQLESGQVPVLEIGLQVGFESPSSFYAAFSRIVGRPPGEYRQQSRKGVAGHGE